MYIFNKQCAQLRKILRSGSLVDPRNAEDAACTHMRHIQQWISSHTCVRPNHPERSPAKLHRGKRSLLRAVLRKVMDNLCQNWCWWELWSCVAIQPIRLAQIERLQRPPSSSPEELDCSKDNSKNSSTSTYGLMR